VQKVAVYVLAAGQARQPCGRVAVPRPNASIAARSTNGRLPTRSTRRAIGDARLAEINEVAASSPIRTICLSGT